MKSTYHKMEDKKENHCYECAGHAKAKGEECSTCDGEGNLNKVKSFKNKN